MRKFIIITVIVSLSILFDGCNVQNTDGVIKENHSVVTNGKNNRENISSQLEYGKPVRVTVALNNYIYEVTNEAITSEELGVNIGSVNRQVSPKPEENGDIARNTLEGPKIIMDNCGKLYEINSTKSSEQIAIETSKGMFRRCKYIGKLK